MAIISGQRHDPLRGFKFRVTLYPPQSVGVENITIGCQRVSGLRHETEQVEYRNGDELGSVRKLPGLTTYDNIVLERGQLLGSGNGNAASVMLEWNKLVVSRQYDGLVDEEQIRGRMTIHIYPRGGPAANGDSDAAFEYEYDAVWPAIYEHSDLDGTASDVWFERVEMAVERAGAELTT